MSAKIFRPVFNNDGVHSTCGNRRKSSGGLPQRTSGWQYEKASKSNRLKIWLGVIIAHLLILNFMY